MSSLVVAIALWCVDSTVYMPVSDSDTLSVVGTITEPDTSWWQYTMPSISITPTSWNQIRLRAQASPLDTPLGILVNIDSLGVSMSGLWSQHSFGWTTVFAGDVVGSYGTGLVFGTSRGGLRSSRSIQPPSNALPMLRPCRSTLRDPAIRGLGITALLDSQKITASAMSGISLYDSSYTTIMMGSIIYGSYTFGAGIMHNASISSLTGSAWMHGRTERTTYLAELAFSRSIVPSMQCYYRYGAGRFSIAATAWRIDTESNLQHGSLLLRSSSSNSWGYAFSVGQTLPRLVGWNALFQSYGTLSRSYYLPFPSHNYSLRAEVRQTITALLHATWRVQLGRTDDGATVNGVRGQAQVHSIGLQATVERIVTPKLRWQARADTHWQWTTNGDYQSSAASITVYWEPLTIVSMHSRAIVYASPLYELSTWVMEYTSSDLQRIIVCSGYGAQMHVGTSAAITKSIRLSALGILRYDAASSLATAAGYITAGFALKAP